MTLRATRKRTGVEAYGAYRAQLRQTKRLLNGLDLTVSIVPGRISAFWVHLKSQKKILNELKATEGINRAARQEEDAQYNLTLEHDAFILEVNAVLQAVIDLAIPELSPAETAALKVAINRASAEIV